ncbi:MAG: hypothetical protein ABJD68_14705 [Nakamurella sp.]
MLATTDPSGAAITAPSSPGPSTVLAGCDIPAVIRSMIANSPVEPSVPVAGAALGTGDPVDAGAVAARSAGRWGVLMWHLDGE